MALDYRGSFSKDLGFYFEFDIEEGVDLSIV